MIFATTAKTANDEVRMEHCRKCRRKRELQKHHPLPRRWYGRGKSNNWTVKLCADCHKVADDLTYQIDNHYEVNRANAHLFADLFTETFNGFLQTAYHKALPETYQLTCQQAPSRMTILPYVHNGHFPCIIYLVSLPTAKKYPVPFSGYFLC